MAVAHVGLWTLCHLPAGRMPALPVGAGRPRCGRVAWFFFVGFGVWFLEQLTLECIHMHGRYSFSGKLIR